MIDTKPAKSATVLLELARRPFRFTRQDFFHYLLLLLGFVMLGTSLWDARDALATHTWTAVLAASGFWMMVGAIVELRASYTDRRIDALVDLLTTTQQGSLVERPGDR